MVEEAKRLARQMADEREGWLSVVRLWGAQDHDVVVAKACGGGGDLHGASRT